MRLDSAAAQLPRASAPATISGPGMVLAVTGMAALLLPFVQVKANRIVAGEGLRLDQALDRGWLYAAAFAIALVLCALPAVPQLGRLLVGFCGAVLSTAAVGSTVGVVTPSGDTLMRVSPSGGFWLLTVSFALLAADAQARMQMTLARRWLLLAAVCAAVVALLASGWLDGLSVMREHAARAEVFGRAVRRHLLLAFGSVGAALLVGVPIGVLLHWRARLRGGVLGTLNLLQTIPSLAMFGVMIPLFGWVALNVPGAARAGIAGIGAFPALVALFLYSLLPVVSNTVAGLGGVSAEARSAARGLGMTDRQILMQVSLPLALPAILAAVRIVLVQNIGLAVIAGLIGGGGLGTFVFQGLAQTAMDLVMLGALPTIAMALVTGIALDLLVEGIDPLRRR